MWFGTWDGLNRYDGYDFTVYKNNPENPNSLSNSSIWSLYEDRTGTLWIGTFGGGLNKFDQDTGQFTRYQQDPANLQSLSSNIVMTLYEDRTEALWIGTNAGLNRLNRKTEQFTHYQHDPGDPRSLSHNSVSAIYQDRAGALWIGTFGGGLNRFDPRSSPETFTRYQHDPAGPSNLSNNYVWFIYEDRVGVFWVGTEDGLNIFDRETETFTQYRHNPADPYSLSDNSLWSIHEDRDGALWIGTEKGGLNIFDREHKRFMHYQHAPNVPDGLSDNSIRSIYEDQAGGLWFGTYQAGINTFDDKRAKFPHYRRDPDDPNSLSSHVIWSLYEDRAGILWIGTDGGGLNRVDRKSASGAGQFTHYRHDPDDPQSLSHNKVRTMYEDRAGTLWVGTEGGLNRFNRETGQFTHYQHDPNNPHSLSHNTILSIYEDQTGIFWIGTEGRGLDKFDPRLNGADTGQFAHYQHDPDDPRSLSNNHVPSLHEDQAGTLWIGTGGGGLDKFDRKNETFTHYREKDGLPNDVIFGILEDEQGFLWLSTVKGLSRFDPRAATCKNYDVSDGLQDNEFNIGAYHQSRAGEMFFGGSNGFNAFYPAKVEENPSIPPIVITDFQLLYESVIPGQEAPLQTPVMAASEIELSYRDNVFSFEFAALDFTASGKNQYAYRLEGFDDDWIFTSAKRRFAPYTNLDPGKYVFRVKGSNNDGIWNEKGVSIKITVTPPWWETIWFRASMLILVLGWIFGGFRWRVQIIMNQKRQLEMQVNERTHQLSESTQRLEQEITEHKQAEEALREKTHELGERVKELNCLYGLAQLVETADISLSGIFQGIVELLPPAWQYPDITCARLVCDDYEYHTENFTATPWQQTAGIHVHGQPLGRLEVGYTEERPLRDEGPFLREERWLLEALAERLGRIIERQQAEEELRLNRQTVEYMAEGVNLTNSDGIILYTNPAYNRMFGYEAGELPGMHVSVVNAPTENTPEETFADIMSTLHECGYWEGELVNIKKDGTHFPTYAKITSFQHSIHDQIWLSVQEDITERKQTEEELRKAKEAALEAQRAAEAANRAKSAFLANMSHELRTPLNAILGFSQLLGHSTNLDPKQQEDVAIIRRSGEHLLTLINQVLDLSKIEAGRLTLDERNVDLHRLLDDVERLFRLRANAKGVSLRFERAPDLPRYVRTDDIKLRQVLINLLSNAMKSTEEGGVTLEVTQVTHVTHVEEDDLTSHIFQPVSGQAHILTCEISDTGPGIAPEELPTLFGAFVQTASGRASHGGTGLGLTISQRFVQLMGGEIRVESDVGRGTTATFHIHVGLADASDRDSETPGRHVIALEPNQPRYRLLIVDDNADNRRLLIDVLHPFDFDLREAENGQAALAIWDAWQPHLVWMDLKMPVMDGYEATKHMRNAEAGMRNEASGMRDSQSSRPHCTIIAVTAVSFAEEQRAALAVGCDDFVRKPFREADIFDILHRHLGLQFVYAEEPNADGRTQTADGSEVLTPDALAALPEEWRAALQVAAEKISVTETNAVLDRIRERDEPLADALAGLVKTYRFDILQELLITDCRLQITD